MEEKHMLSYPIVVTPDTNDTLLVTFPDIPEANSVAKDLAEVMREGLDALETALELYFETKRPIPLPSQNLSEQARVTLPALPSAKVLLWNEMCAQKIRKADLARLLDVHMPQIDRLFDLRHSSKIEFLERAANAMGKSLRVSLA
jgi:antitoxin HicB